MCRIGGCGRHRPTAAFRVRAVGPGLSVGQSVLLRARCPGLGSDLRIAIADRGLQQGIQPESRNAMPGCACGASLKNRQSGPNRHWPVVPFHIFSHQNQCVPRGTGEFDTIQGNRIGKNLPKDFLYLSPQALRTKSLTALSCLGEGKPPASVRKRQTFSIAGGLDGGRWSVALSRERRGRAKPRTDTVGSESLVPEEASNTCGSKGGQKMSEECTPVGIGEDRTGFEMLERLLKHCCLIDHV